MHLELPLEQLATLREAYGKHQAKVRRAMAELDRLTGGTAMHWMALSHYAHVERR